MKEVTSDLSRSYPPTPKTKSMSTAPNFALLICAMLLMCWKAPKSEVVTLMLLTWIKLTLNFDFWHGANEIENSAERTRA